MSAGKTVSGSGLEAGSKVGISGANIPSTLVTGYADDSENGYFTADRTDTKLKATTGGGLELDKQAHAALVGQAELDKLLQSGGLPSLSGIGQIGKGAAPTAKRPAPAIGRSPARASAAWT